MVDIKAPSITSDVSEILQSFYKGLLVRWEYALYVFMLMLVLYA
jgi:hypothetical protein